MCLPILGPVKVLISNSQFDFKIFTAPLFVKDKMASRLRILARIYRFHISGSRELFDEKHVHVYWWRHYVWGGCDVRSPVLFAEGFFVVFCQL